MPEAPVVDARLIEGWLKARSAARALPMPVADHGGWRVDTASKTEIRRYVFAVPSEGLRVLGEEITVPRIYLKLCASENTMRRMLPDRWELQSGTYVMTIASDRLPDFGLPAGYTHTIFASGNTLALRILSGTGQLAASGFAAELDGVFAYDRILTDAAHRRLGLGRAVMALLGAARRSATSRQVLVATEDGRALYETIGWAVVAPYTTAVLPFEARASV